MSKWVELEKEDGTSYLIPAKAIVAAERFKAYKAELTRIYVKGLQLHVQHQANREYSLYKPEGDIEIIEVTTDIKALSFMLPMVEETANV